MSSGDMIQAEAAFLKAVHLGPPPVHFHTEIGVGTYLSCQTLAQIYEQLGDDVSAVRWYAETFVRHPEGAIFLQKITRIFKTLYSEENIPALLQEKFIIHDQPESIWEITRMLIADRCYHAAYTLLLYDYSAEYHQDRMTSLIRCSFLSGSLEMAGKLLHLSPSLPSDQQQLLKHWIDSKNNKDPHSMIEILKSIQEKDRSFIIESLYNNDYTFLALRHLGEWLHEGSPSAELGIEEEAYSISRTLSAMAEKALNSSRSEQTVSPIYQRSLRFLPLPGNRF